MIDATLKELHRLAASFVVLQAKARRLLKSITFSKTVDASVTVTPSHSAGFTTAPVATMRNWYRATHGELSSRPDTVRKNLYLRRLQEISKRSNKITTTSHSE